VDILGISSLTAYLKQHATKATRSTQTPRVLLSAYQCAPNGESVSQIGWHWYQRLANQVPTTLITHIRNRPALSAAGAPFGDSEIIYIDTEWFAGPLYRLASRLFPNSEHVTFMFSSIDAYLYDWYAVRLLRKRQRQGEDWDVVHVVTPVTPKLATRLHRLGKPVILGPWNGNMPTPKNFPDIMRKDSAWLFPLRNLAQIPQRLWGTLRHAHTVLIATQATLGGIPKAYWSRCLRVVENGVDLDSFQPAPYPPAPSVKHPLRIVYVGRLIPLKAVNLLLEAAARIRNDVPLQLDIIGTGPEQAAWQALATKLGLQAQINWYGRLSVHEVVQHLQHAHVLCLPSIRESGGAVLLEAMACARPVIALNFGGPAELVDDEVGRLLPADNADTVVTHLMSALTDVATQSDQWKQRGLTGRQRVEAWYSWDAKVAQGIALYQSIMTHPQ